MNRVFRLRVEGDEVVFGVHRIALLDFPSWWRKGYNEDIQKSAIEDNETGDVVDASPESVTALASSVRFAAQEGEIPIDLAQDFLRAADLGETPEDTEVVLFGWVPNRRWSPR